MSRTTGASMVGAIFHVGARLGSGFTAANSRAMNSAGETGVSSAHGQDVVSPRLVFQQEDQTG